MSPLAVFVAVTVFVGDAVARPAGRPPDGAVASGPDHHAVVVAQGSSPGGVGADEVAHNLVACRSQAAYDLDAIATIAREYVALPSGSPPTVLTRASKISTPSSAFTRTCTRDYLPSKGCVFFGRRNLLGLGGLSSLPAYATRCPFGAGGRHHTRVKGIIPKALPGPRCPRRSLRLRHLTCHVPPGNGRTRWPAPPVPSRAGRRLSAGRRAAGDHPDQLRRR